MGGCWSNGRPEQQAMALAVDQGAGLAAVETSWTAQIGDDDVRASDRALERVLRHRSALIARNPLGAAFDQPLRAALTHLISGKLCQPNADTAIGLRYLRDRISVPRDMPLQSARLLRKALEATAALDGEAQPAPPPFEHRFDQDPRPFLNP
jgi:glutathione S-transferase